MYRLLPFNFTRIANHEVIVNEIIENVKTLTVNISWLLVNGYRFQYCTLIFPLTIQACL